MAKRIESTPSGSVAQAQKLPGQVVLVLQGGGALGAYQSGIYEALHEAGIEPNWVIGTSIGAINAGIIAGNPADKRLDQLRKFWTTMEYKPWWGNSPYLAPWLGSGRLLADFTNQSANMMALFGGVAGYYTPNHALAPEPQSLEDVLSRQKDIQFASRDDSHIARQQDLHRLRHIVRELVKLVPEDQRISPEVKRFAAYGCRTFMHVVRLNAPHIEGEGNSRDIDFTSASIRARWKAGHEDTARALERRPWEDEFDPMAGVAVHNCEPAMLGRV